MKPNHKIILTIIGAAAIIAAGCKAIGSDPTPPSSFEQHLYDVQTNRVPQTVVTTNVITATNTITLTNTIDHTVTTTNVVTPEKVYETNVVQKEVYTLTPNSNAKTGAQVAGTIGNAVLPGSGDLISLIALALVGAWGHLRSYKKGQTAETAQATSSALVQEMQTVLELVGKLPNGDKMVPAITAFLSQHQAEEGVVQQVIGIIQNDLNCPQATGAATEIQALIDSFNKAATAPKV